MVKKQMIPWLAVLLVTVGFMQSNGTAEAAALNRSEPAAAACYSVKMAQFQAAMEKLWIDHVVWTRNYIVSAVSGTEDQQVILARLLKNQQDIGDAVKPLYGEAAGNQLAELLREHILLAGKVLEAAKSGNDADLKKYNKEWHRNADDIAKFMSAANPYWSQKELQSMLYTHLQFVTDAVMARLKKDWSADVTALDKGEAHMVMFADVLSKGLFQQFPQKFQ